MTQPTNLIERLIKANNNMDDEGFKAALNDVRKIVMALAEVHECGEPSCDDCHAALEDALEVA